jgi:hypothetical protein
MLTRLWLTHEAARPADVFCDLLRQILR